MLFSGGLVPGYLLIRNLGLINSLWVYVIPTLVSAFNILILRNFFQSIPDSLAESAMMDGANDFAILFRIYQPLSKPALATIALWTAVSHWNSWFDGLLYVTDNSKQVLQVFLRRIVIENSTEMIEKGIVNPDAMSFTPETIKAATVVVTVLPILAFYPFVQRYFEKGVLLGSLKG
jgi:putative aldouronate transport system permease protein